jgi:signal transduction histidine kinase
VSSERWRRGLAPLGWWRRRSLRFRLTVAAAAVFALALALSAWLLVDVLGRVLVASVDEAAHAHAREIRTQADAGTLPTLIPVSDGLIVQVLDPAGRITHATADAWRAGPLLAGDDLAGARDGDRGRFARGQPYGVHGPLRCVAVRTERGMTVIVARSFGDAVETVGAATHLLLLGTPGVLVLLATASWIIIGRTLHPIAALRRGAAEISETARSRRLPVPEARDEVHSLATTLNDMLARLEAAETRQRALISDAAHELRSPLASIRLQLEVALGHPERQDWRETAEGVLEDTLRLSRLAEDLLALARLDERGGVPGRSDPVDLAEVVAQTVERYGEAGVVWQGAGEPVRVRGDALDLGRVLTNLIDNAVRHAAAKVEVGLRTEGADVVLTVTDDGPGIPATDRERVFDRFTRLDSARSRDEGGAGLGLAIVRETVRAHGGSVLLDDAAPGVRAVVRLPRISTDH